MEKDTIFRIYSMTKPITSIALMMLHEEGKFQLIDPVSRYISAFGNTKVLSGFDFMGQKLVAQNPPMNIHHLLTHTAGLSYGFHFDSPIDEMYRDSIFRSETATLEEKIVGMAALPLRFQPGSAWHLQHRHRCLRLPGAAALGYALRRLPGRAHLRAAWHERHRLPCVAGQA